MEYDFSLPFEWYHFRSDRWDISKVKIWTAYVQVHTIIRCSCQEYMHGLPLTGGIIADQFPAASVDLQRERRRRLQPQQSSNGGNNKAAVMDWMLTHDNDAMPLPRAFKVSLQRRKSLPSFRGQI